MPRSDCRSLQDQIAGGARGPAGAFLLPRHQRELRMSMPVHLAMPMAGAHPQELEDTLNEIHASHKHEALHVPAPWGTPVLAVAEGNVVKLFTSKQGGLTVYQSDDRQNATPFSRARRP